MLIPSLCDLKQPEAHSDFAVPSMKIPKYVLVVMSHITPPTMEEFLLPLLTERIEAVKNSKMFPLSMTYAKECIYAKKYY